jgi:hypothetical protein
MAVPRFPRRFLRTRTAKSKSFLTHQMLRHPQSFHPSLLRTTWGSAVAGKDRFPEATPQTNIASRRNRLPSTSRSATGYDAYSLPLGPMAT